MKVSQWFLILLLGFFATIILTLLSEPPADAVGKGHDLFKTMAHSGDSVTSSDYVKWLAYLFGFGIICVFGFAVAFGAKKSEQLQGIKPWLILGVIAYLLVYSLMIFNYWTYSDAGVSGYFGGLPTPTALMLYGLGSIPIVLTIVYIVKFKTWILTEEDEEKFNKIVARRNKKKSSNPPR